MLFSSDCHVGKDIRWPELSNLHDQSVVWSASPEIEWCVPVLAPGCAVQVNDQLKAVIIGPCDRVSEIRKLSLNVRFSPADIPSPISYRQPYVVQPGQRFEEAISAQYGEGKGGRETRRRTQQQQ